MSPERVRVAMEQNKGNETDRVHALLAWLSGDKREPLIIGVNFGRTLVASPSRRRSSRCTKSICPRPTPDDLTSCHLKATSHMIVVQRTPVFDAWVDGLRDSHGEGSRFKSG